jgi:hypothetical protein
MPNTNDKSGPDSTSEQPNVASSTNQDNQAADKTKKEGKGAKVRAMSGPNGTSEQP